MRWAFAGVGAAGRGVLLDGVSGAALAVGTREQGAGGGDPGRLGTRSGAVRGVRDGVGARGGAPDGRAVLLAAVPDAGLAAASGGR
ncbi:hypothetical protein [Actinosynnema sp. ALI-1.44]|uniref:hypothetical protein n=1 Tax=Actinosynnema sp. ALI-1.44 TaxID=1933779 RepID=UPI00143D7967|nr:hypothetical protein [Actinosynnema sp. ALI-1.44]